MDYKKWKDLKVKYEHKPRVDNLIFRLHYRYTVAFFLVAAFVSTLTDLFAPEKKRIICMLETDQDDLKKAVESYCYITGTYTVDKLHYSGSDYDVPHPGVGPHKEDDAITYHTFYQWVPFVLVAQGALFYLPHYIWKGIEKGIFKIILQKLTIGEYLSGKSYGDRHTQFELLALYIRDNFNKHKLWAYKFIFCELLNVLVTIFTLFFTNYFLGGEFFTYGIKVFTLTSMDPENRTDPMAQVFPQMGKCLFKLYGPSGTIEKRDVMCLLPFNVLYEKIYIVMWVWLIVLLTIGIAWMLKRIFSLVRFFREPIFKFRTVKLPRINKKTTEMKGNLATSSDVKNVLNHLKTFSDYILLSQLGDHMETCLFSEFIHYLSEFLDGSNMHYKSSNSYNTGDDSGVSETGSVTKESVYPPSTPPEQKRLMEGGGGKGGAYPPLQLETTFD